MPSLKEMLAAKQGKAPTQAGECVDGPNPSVPLRFPSEQERIRQEVQAQVLHKLNPLAQPMPDKFPGTYLPKPRQLDQAGPAEPIPAASTAPWDVARAALETSLVIWVEPAPGEHAWIAVRHATGADEAPLILLHRLPLANRRNPNGDEPF